MQTPAVNIYQGQRPKEYAFLVHLVFVVISFSFISALTVRLSGNAAFTVIFVIFGSVFIRLGILFVSLFLTTIIGNLPFRVAFEATASGFFALVPFACLAIVAELVLGWSAVHVFTSAGLMASGGGTAVELAQRGVSGKLSIIAPLILGFLMSFLWLVSSAALAQLL
jgi:hypothetical protein